MGVKIIGRYGYSMQAGEMRDALGVKKLPKEAMPEREIAGVRVYVKAQDPVRSRRRPHRVFAICTCGQHVPFGRLHQHKCKQEDLEKEFYAAQAREAQRLGNP